MDIEAFEDPFQYLPGWYQYRDFRNHTRIRLAPHLGDSLHFTREDDLIGGALIPVDGHVEVPDAPGLDIELDMVAVEKYRVG